MTSASPTPVPPPLPPVGPRFRWGVLLKVSGIVVLILLLHVPLALTRGVLAERQSYQAQASDEVAAVWGRRQTLIGPVLMVPYTFRGVVTRQRIVGDKVIQVEENDSIPAVAYFLPTELDLEARVETEVRRRGIYDTVVYATTVTLAGEFQPDFVAADLTAEQIQWDRAQVLISVSDLRGLRSVSPWPDGTGTAPFEATENLGAGFPLAAKVRSAAAGTALPFRLTLSLQGSEQLNLTPIGKTTKAALRSEWPDPSFVGAYLPVERQVTAEGFSATWQTAHFSRGFPQSWSDELVTVEDMLNKISATAFGVEFQQTMDGYRLVERAQKYGVLFFVISFAVFFLFETTARLRIHPFQYSLVGAALCLFFLGFLALSEVMGTGWAYAVAAGACTAMITLYAWTFLSTGRRALLVGGGLAGTYAYLYFVLQSQDYALLAGSAALFVLLALVMYGTRTLNWYQLELPTNSDNRRTAP